MSKNKKLVIIAAILISIGLVFNLNRGVFHEPFLAEEERIANTRLEAECLNYPSNRVDFKSGVVVPDECGRTIRGEVVHPGFMAMFIGSLVSLLTGVALAVTALIGSVLAWRRRRR